MNIRGLKSPANIAVLIHGCHVHACEWDRIIVGELPTMPGRAPVGLEVALQLGTDLVVWGTGASERDGIKEAQLIYDTTLRCGREVLAYINRGVPWLHDIDDLAGFMQRVSVLDTHTQNTKDEVDHATRLALTQGKRVLVQVSSPTHIARCYMEGLKWKENNPKEDITFIPFPSRTCFAGASAEDVVIAEPPHRGDNLPLWLGRLLRPLFKLMVMSEGEARPILTDVCSSLEKYGIKVDPSSLIQS